MRKILMVFLVAISLLLVACGQTAQVNDNTVVVGWMGPLSGDAASYGESILKGAKLAFKDEGLDVKLVTEDSKCDGKEAVSAINKLVSVDKVVVVLGEVCSGATLAAAPIAEQNGVSMISASSTSPEISDAGDYIFRTVPSDALQGAFGAELVAAQGHTKLAVLHGNEDYGIGFKSVLEENFPLEGGEVVAAEAFTRGSVDMRTQLTKIKNSGADSIYIISNSPDSGVAALKQIEELGLEVAVFGSEGLKSDDVLKGAGKAAEGLVLTSVSGGSSSFVARHQQEYNEAPGPFAAQGYDAAKAVALVIKNGAKTAEEIKDALYSVSFGGASGSISFDTDGDVEGNYDVFVVKNGEWSQQ